MRVHRACRQWGVPIQYSVFLVPADARQHRGLIAELRELIDERADDVRVYPLPERVEVEPVRPSGPARGHRAGR